VRGDDTLKSDEGCGLSGAVPGELTFGIVICNDSNFPEHARQMAAKGAAVLFVTSNNGLPEYKAERENVAEARRVDQSIAVENSLWVIRADVAGRRDGLVSYGMIAIVDPGGRVLVSAAILSETLIVAETRNAYFNSSGRTPFLNPPNLNGNGSYCPTISTDDLGEIFFSRPAVQ
jgi:predicted amidohydrolase